MRNSSKVDQFDFITQQEQAAEPERPVSPQTARSFHTTALFAGVAGLEVGLARAGHQVSLFCERDAEAAAVLALKYPKVPIVRDVRDTAELLEKIPSSSTLITAGFPCTDLSQAGETKGFEGPNSSLVRNVFQLLSSGRFPHLLLENVPNWRSLHGGAYMEEVLKTLEGLGYRWAYRTIDALAFGLPQRRKRIFLYATTDGDPRDVLFQGGAIEPEEPELALNKYAHGFYWTEGNTGIGWGENCVPTLKGGSGVGIPSPPAILRTDGSVITPDIKDAEALQGFKADWTSADAAIDPDGSTRPFNHRRRWLLVGNAVNIEVSTWIGERLARPRTFKGQLGKPLPKGSRFPVAAYGSSKGRFAVSVSTWPVSRKRKDLEDFLRYEGSPLSHRATQGFYTRARKSKLRIDEPFFIALEKHLKRMSRDA